jgi:delta14-sterol reductase
LAARKLSLTRRHNTADHSSIGATGIVFGLPILMNVMYLTCNDVSGCPAPALLSPSTLTLESLKAQIPWPENGLSGLVSWRVSAWLAAYYALSLILYRVLPAEETLGTKLRESGKPLTYRFNAFGATIAQLIPCLVGTYIYGADFPVWTFITDNYLQLLWGNIILAYAISVITYVASFSVKPNDPTQRELAVGGHTGVAIYDFFIGRELNPRVNVPLIGEVDVKAWLEMRPGLTGWLLLNLAFVAKQWRNYGYLSDSICFISAVQAYYVLEGQYAESGILGMMDITTDGLGFMLTFGDIVWVPFLYTTQVRYLSTYPVHLGWRGLAIVSMTFAVGLFIFRSANSQKARFRKDPTAPEFANATFLQTKRGTRLLTSGWWGRSRHINYFGDWLQSLPFCLPTGIAGYVVLPVGAAVITGMGPEVAQMLDGRVVVPGTAEGWGMLYTYFYSAWFGFLLVHREMRDDKACQEKYGEDWDKYKQTVKYKIIPGVY